MRNEQVAACELIDEGSDTVEVRHGLTCAEGLAVELAELESVRDRAVHEGYGHRNLPRGQWGLPVRTLEVVRRDEGSRTGVALVADVASDVRGHIMTVVTLAIGVFCALPAGTLLQDSAWSSTTRYFTLPPTL